MGSRMFQTQVCLGIVQAYLFSVLKTGKTFFLQNLLRNIAYCQDNFQRLVDLQWIQFSAVHYEHPVVLSMESLIYIHETKSHRLAVLTTLFSPLNKDSNRFYGELLSPLSIAVHCSDSDKANNLLTYQSTDFLFVESPWPEDCHFFLCRLSKRKRYK